MEAPLIKISSANQNYFHKSKDEKNGGVVIKTPPKFVIIKKAYSRMNFEATKMAIIN